MQVGILFGVPIVRTNTYTSYMDGRVHWKNREHGQSIFGMNLLAPYCCRLALKSVEFVLITAQNIFWNSGKLVLATTMRFSKLNRYNQHEQIILSLLMFLNRSRVDLVV